MSDKIAVIHQPDFLPYLGFFDRLIKADVYVVLDTVQFSKRWSARDKIKTREGAVWITAGTKKAPVDTPINKMVLTDTRIWKKKHLNLLAYNYGKAPYYHEIMPYIEKLYALECEMLFDFTMASINMLIELFGISVEMIIANTLNPVGHNNDLNVDILTKIGCKKYLSGVGAKDYYNPEPFEAAGIEVIWQDFKHPVYPQQFGEFIPYLSSIDLLFNCGIEESRRVIRQG